MLYNGQVDSLELPETPEIEEMTENFTKVTKYLAKFKETLINCLGKISRQKSSKNKIFRGFCVFEYVLWQKNENTEMPEINIKLSKSKKHSVLTFYRH